MARSAFTAPRLRPQRLVLMPSVSKGACILFPLHRVTPQDVTQSGPEEAGYGVDRPILKKIMLVVVVGCGLFVAQS